MMVISSTFLYHKYMPNSVTNDYSTLQELLEIDSPSGFTYDACDYIVDYLNKLGFHPTLTNKGAVRCQFGDNPKLHWPTPDPSKLKGTEEQIIEAFDETIILIREKIQTADFI